MKLLDQLQFLEMHLKCRSSEKKKKKLNHTFLTSSDQQLNSDLRFSTQAKKREKGTKLMRYFNKE